MSNGWTHSGVTIGASTGIIAGYLSAYVCDSPQVLIAAFGTLTGVLLSPDLDHDSGYIGYWYIRKVGGKIGELYWHALWRPYTQVVKHREPLSHFPVISTVFRLIYLLIPSIIILSPNRKEISGGRIVIAQIAAAPFLLCGYSLGIQPYYSFPFFVGLCISDILHYIFDFME